jgi:hypothetical protein
MLNRAVAEKTARDLYQVKLHCACGSMRTDVCVNNRSFRERPNDLVRNTRVGASANEWANSVKNSIS